MDAESSFNDVVADTDYAMYVVTVAASEVGDGDHGGPARSGCLVGFTTQCSITPPRFLVCLSKANRTYRVALRAPVLAVHLLREDQRDLASLFGENTGDDLDKFERCPWRAGPEGVPLLEDCDSWFVGSVLSRFDLGDHEAFHLAPVEARKGPPLRPLTFQSVLDLVPGHRVEEGSSGA